jgi:hypothetical protein
LIFHPIVRTVIHQRLPKATTKINASLRQKP